MSNKIEVSTDGVCVFLDTKMKSSIITKIVVTIITLIVFIPFGIMVYSTRSLEIKEVAFGLIAYLVIAGGITLRFAFWQLFGEENIVISTKSIKYQRAYGMFRTNPTIIELNELAVGFNKEETLKNGTELGNIHFVNYDKLEQNNLVFESSIRITPEQYEEFNKNLSFIYYNKDVKNGKITEITLN